MFRNRLDNRLFEALGMRIKSREGYLYPASDQASCVLDLLRYELDRQRITVHTGKRIAEVRPQNGKFFSHPIRQLTMP